ncbi:DUF1398 domain-containing protein [Pedobacter ginsengisoli]|uniref:DUF1398 domain-containing protein n=1 Tax=Pedobacter ginsengisoli TaxID=363852 RepID=UPI00254CFBFC|nr:DUF1398 family protein [Pedobacter ginsengisoli]
MFTVEQICAAHRKVKSGADFPAYIQEIKSLGVTHYEAYVSDGHTDYHGAGGHSATVPAKYESIAVADAANIIHFKAELAAHQQGKSDFLTFIKMCAANGVKKWEVSIEKMICTYFDKAGKQIWTEQIPNH